MSVFSDLVMIHFLELSFTFFFIYFCVLVHMHISHHFSYLTNVFLKAKKMRNFLKMISLLIEIFSLYFYCI